MRSMSLAPWCRDPLMMAPEKPPRRPQQGIGLVSESQAPRIPQGDSLSPGAGRASAYCEGVQQRRAHRRRSAPNHPLQLTSLTLRICRQVRQGEEPIGEVLVDVGSHEAVKRPPPVCDVVHLLACERWEHKPVSNVDTELVTAPPPTGMAPQAVSQTAGAANGVCAEQDGLGRASGQSHVDELVTPPDRVQ